MMVARTLIQVIITILASPHQYRSPSPYSIQSVTTVSCITNSTHISPATEPIPLPRDCNQLQAMSLSEPEKLLKQLQDNIRKKDEELDAFVKQCMETTLQSVTNSVKSATSSLVERQEVFEQKTMSRLSSLVEQISSLSSCIQQSGVPASAVMATLPANASTITYTCNVCSKTLLSKADLASHVTLYHTSPIPDTCPVCGKVFRDGAALRAHVSDNHGHNADATQFETASTNRYYPQHDEPILASSLPDKSQPSSLVTPVHTFLCEYCNLSFSCDTELRVHKEQHHALLDMFKCQECDMAFTSRPNLENHVVTRHGQGGQTVHCLLCQLSFSSMSDLNYHCMSGHPPPSTMSLSPTASGPSIPTYQSSTARSPGTPPGPELELPSTMSAPCQDPIYEAASRTIGFWPVFFTVPTDIISQDIQQSHLYTGLQRFFTHDLGIPNNIINNMRLNRIFSEVNVVFVEFASQREVNTIFKYSKNLPPESHVQRYIHPSLRPKHKMLVEKAFTLRKANGVQTKIVYDGDDLGLFTKLPSVCTWSKVIDASQDLSDMSFKIPQVDGCGDSDIDSIGTQQVEHHNITQQGQCTSVQATQGHPHSPHKAAYFLNRKKQSDKICHDASKDNMEVTVNNSDTNVNIQCSSGFYVVVARPCVSSFTRGSTCQSSDIQISCSEEFHQVDKSGAPDFTRLSFELKGHDMSLLGKVTVHLRHSTRLVQVQGSAKMPDKTTAAVWFAEQFLTKKFQDLAKTRAYDISSFNNEILKMSRLHHNTVRSEKCCAQCSKLFSSSSKPVPCSSCQRKIHRGCSKLHLSLCTNAVDVVEATISGDSPPRPPKRTRTSSSSATITSAASSCSSTPVFLNSITSDLITSGIATFTGRRTLVSFVPEVTAVPSTSNTVSVVPRSTSSVFSSAVFSTSTTTVSSLPSTGTPNIILSSGSLPRQTKNPAATNRKKPRTETSPENEQISFLTTELNYAHTRIVTQDNTIKDLESKVKILKESLRLSEEKLNNDLHNKYFGSTFPSASFCSFSHQSPCNHSCCSTACPRTRPSPCSGSSAPSSSAMPTQSYHASPSWSPQQSETEKKSYEKILSEINQMKVDIMNISSKVDSLLIPTTSLPSPTIVSTQVRTVADIHINCDNDVTIASLDEDITNDVEQNPSSEMIFPTNQSN